MRSEKKYWSSIAPITITRSRRESIPIYASTAMKMKYTRAIRNMVPIIRTCNPLSFAHRTITIDLPDFHIPAEIPHQHNEQVTAKNYCSSWHLSHRPWDDK